MTEPLLQYNGYSNENIGREQYRAFRDKVLDIVKDDLWEGFSKTDGKILKEDIHRKFHLADMKMKDVFKQSFPIEYMMTSPEDVDIYKYKQGLMIQTKGKNYDGEYLHEFLLLPACKEGYIRDWEHDGVCVKKC